MTNLETLLLVVGGIGAVAYLCYQYQKEINEQKERWLYTDKVAQHYKDLYLYMKDAILSHKKDKWAKEVLKTLDTAKKSKASMLKTVYPKQKDDPLREDLCSYSVVVGGKNIELKHLKGEHRK